MSPRPGRKANTTDPGLGWKHQQQAEGLLRRRVDGTLCWWCGLPMFKRPCWSATGIAKLGHSADNAPIAYYTASATASAKTAGTTRTGPWCSTFIHPSGP